MARSSLAGLLVPFVLAVSPASAGEITPTTGAGGLGSRVNRPGGSCASGFCRIDGGKESGKNLFHRFSAFDTRNGITGVSIDSSGKSNVIVGVTNRLGSFIDTSIELINGSANLFWLSPGGIRISSGGGFVNVNQLNLSTATGLRFANGTFDALTTTSAALEAPDAFTGDPVAGPAGMVTDPDTMALLGLPSNGDLVLESGVLTVDSGLLLDSQGGNVLFQGDNQIAFTSTSGGTGRVSGAADISGGELTIERPSDADPLAYNFYFDSSLSLRGADSAIGGSANVETNGTFDWADGATIRGGGALTTNAASTLSGGQALTIEKPVWINRGRVEFMDETSLLFPRGGIWANDTTGEIVLDNGAVLPSLVVASNKDFGSLIIANSGLIRKSSSANQGIEAFLFSNSGTLALDDGSLAINSMFTQQTGSIALSENTALNPILALGSDSNSQIDNSGTISGNGTIRLGPLGEGTLVNAADSIFGNFGKVSPGGDGKAGRIVIEGSFVQEQDGAFVVLDLGGPAPGASDSLEVTGIVNLLGGTLDLGTSFIGGYVPAPGDQIEVIKADGGLTIGQGLDQRTPPNVSPLTSDNAYGVVVQSPPTPPGPGGPTPPQPPVTPPQPPVIPPEPPIVERPPEPPPVISPPVTPPVMSLPPTVNEPVATTSTPPPRIEEPELLLPLLVDQKQFLLTALATPSSVEAASRLQALLQVEFDDGSFSSSGEGGATGPGANRGPGPATTLGPQQTRENFLQGESQAQRDTAAKLGLSDASGRPAPSPERLQCVLREVKDWMRTGQPQGTGSEEEDPCRS